ncbi:MAG TPA: NPCBM/NEW2 domain-containing protein [Tepidisphaeraceae bacterium]|nr:NPCBM/NEW2 domain-containing protein [Tepidisphaeraceae bacterium]
MVGIIIALMATSALAQTPWQLETSDFQTQSVNVLKMTGSGVDYTTADGAGHHVPMERFLELRRGESKATSPDKLVLVLSDGERFAGQAVAMGSENLRWHNPLLGELSFPVRGLVGIKLPGSPSSATTRPTEDIVHLANGDTVQGVITGLDAKGVTIQTTAASPTVAWNTISGIDFASLGSSEVRSRGGWEIGMDDGSVFRTTSIAWSGNAIDVTLDKQKRSIDQSHVVDIEQVDGPVVYLSAIPMNQDVQIPLLGAPWPAKVGEDLVGRPMPHAISVHAYSRLVWNLPGGYSRLHLEYSIPADLPLADVTVQVQIDGRVVYQQEHQHGGASPAAIEIPLNGGHQLSLEADTANPYRVQGFLTWIAPALVR